MKATYLLQLLKKGQFVVPLYLFQLKSKLDITSDEFLFLMYLMNKGENTIFDPSRFELELGISLLEVMGYISSLTDKKILGVHVSKNDKGIMNEYIDLSYFYDKVMAFFVEDMNQPDEGLQESIYEVFEREFGRTLSPMEYEIIKAWLDSHMSRDLILRALREATYNGVSNLRYIDKILYEWDKKGFKTEKEVDSHQTKRREDKKDKPKIESFDYNWFDDEDEK